MRTSAKANERNRRDRSRCRTAEKRVLITEDKVNSLEQLKNAYEVLDRMTAKGILHRRTAARRKARLARHSNSLNS
ncbi:MAG: 30S ribosomal protein S20 [Calditrichaeota bacterium]|nr:30S ribosomal protein S20 [Calditrichota bacterium]MCB9366414.1 30S ribosomal protein S20 [Calditrichota bacterium]